MIMTSYFRPFVVLPKCSFGKYSGQLVDGFHEEADIRIMAHIYQDYSIMVKTVINLLSAFMVQCQSL